MEASRAGSKPTFEEQQVKPHQIRALPCAERHHLLMGGRAAASAAVVTTALSSCHRAGAWAWQRRGPARSPSCKAVWERRFLTIAAPMEEVAFAPRRLMQLAVPQRKMPGNQSKRPGSSSHTGNAPGLGPEGSPGSQKLRPRMAASRQVGGPGDKDSWLCGEGEQKCDKCQESGSRRSRYGSVDRASAPD